MATLFLGAAGAFVGSFFGPIGASIGWSLGSALGASLEPAQKIEGPRLTDLKVQGSSYGAPIPIVYGTMRVAGQVIWTTDRVEHVNVTGGGKGGPPEPEVTTYSYTVSFAVELCEGPIVNVPRVWAFGRLIYDNGGGTELGTLPMTIYLGDETQLPDPTMEADKGVGFVSAHRGMAYVVFTDLELEPYGNGIPALEFEVVTRGHATGPIRKIYWNHASAYAFAGGFFPPAGNRPVITQWPGVNAGGEIRVAKVSEPYVEIFDETMVHLREELRDPELDDFPDLVVLTAVSPLVEYTYTPVGMYLLDDVAVPVWVHVGSFSIQDSDQFPSLVHTSISMNDHTPSGAELAAAAGIPEGEFVGGVALSPDRKTMVVLTAPSAVTPGTSIIDKWYRLVNGIVTGSGTVSPALTVGLFGMGPTAATTSGTSTPWRTSSLENNGKWIWSHYGAGAGVGGQVNVFEINAAGNLAHSAIGAYCDFGETESANQLASLRVIREGYAGLVSDDSLAIFTRFDDGTLEVPLSEIVADLSDRSGLDASEYNVTQLTDLVHGFVIGHQMSTRAAIETLTPIYYFDNVESDDVVKFVKRGGNSIITIPDDDLGAYEDGSEAPRLLSTIRTTETELPSILNVTYFNPDADYQTGNQLSRRMIGGSLATSTLQVPIVLPDHKAKQVADSLLFNAWLERERFSFTLPRKYACYEPTDVVTVQGKDLRITKKIDGAAGVYKFDAVLSLYDVFVHGSVSSAAAGFTPPVPSTVSAQASQLLLLDIPLVSDLDDENGFYAAMAGSVDSTWRGATLYKSSDGGTTYTAIATSTTPAVMGNATHVLGDFAGGNIFDESSFVTVVVGAGGGTLASATELAVLNGANTALLGFEILQFKTATLTAENTYRLSGFLRGRRGTEWAMVGHASSERFVLLPVTAVPATFAEMGQPRLYKAVSFGRTIASATAQTFTNMGAALQPYAPVQIGGGTNTTGDVTINWVRRTRIGGAWSDYVDVPLGEASEAYVVQIWDAAYANVARIVTGITAQTWTYTSAMQATDFGADQETVFCTVAQVGKFTLGTQAHGAVAGLGSGNDAVIAPIAPYASGPSSPPPGTGTVNLTATFPTSTNNTTEFVIGNTYVVKFTTGGSAITGGLLYAVENFTTPTYRHGILATDVNGLSPVANGESWGNSLTVHFGTGVGRAALATSTDYYFIIKNETAGGVPSGPLGRAADMRINFVEASTVPVYDYDFAQPRLSGLFLTQPALAVRFYCDHVTSSLGSVTCSEFRGDGRYRTMAISNAPGDTTFSALAFSPAGASNLIWFSVGYDAPGFVRLEAGNYYYANVFGDAWQIADATDEFAVTIMMPVS